jgi:hypothetical protein
MVSLPINLSTVLLVFSTCNAVGIVASHGVGMVGWSSPNSIQDPADTDFD